MKRTRKGEQTRGSGAMLPRENLKYRSSEMARNASKTADHSVNFKFLRPLEETSFNLVPTSDQNLKEMEL